MAGRPADAERWYRRALEDFEATGQQQYVATAANNLAVHRLPAGERPEEFAGRDLLAEAETWARKAAGIMEQIGDPSLRVWTTYGILAQIAQARGDGEGARGWRRKERAAYVAFPGHWARLETQWGPVVQAVAAAARGDAQARAAVAELLGQLARTDDLCNLAAALRRVLEGARDAEALAEELALDCIDYLILHKALEALEAPPGD